MNTDSNGDARPINVGIKLDDGTHLTQEELDKAKRMTEGLLSGDGPSLSALLAGLHRVAMSPRDWQYLHGRA